MPRVLRIINRLNLGGPTYNAAYLTKYLAPEFETLLVAGIKQETEESSEYIVKRMGLEPVYIPEMRRDIHPARDYIAYRKIKKIIREFRPDIVHTHAAKAGTLGRLAAIHSNVPVILHTFHGHVFHSYFNTVKTRIFKSIERYLSRHSSRIIAISEIQKKELCFEHQVSSPEQTIVIPLGFDLTRFRTNQEALRTRFREQYHLSDDATAIMIIGRIVPVKNHGLFVNAFRKVLNEYRGKVVGFIVGDGEDRKIIEELALSLNLRISTPETPLQNADLIFTSWIKDVELALAGADIIALTSRNEGTPVSLIEAQAAGKPVVTTDAGGIGNVVIEGETALLSPSGNADLFANNLIKLLNNSNLRLSMQEKGWPHVRSLYHYERLVEDTRQLYRLLLDQK